MKIWLQKISERGIFWNQIETESYSFFSTWYFLGIKIFTVEKLK